jgi:hypothetical protein
MGFEALEAAGACAMADAPARIRMDANLVQFIEYPRGDTVNRLARFALGAHVYEDQDRVQNCVVSSHIRAGRTD